MFCHTSSKPPPIFKFNFDHRMHATFGPKCKLSVHLSKGWNGLFQPLGFKKWGDRGLTTIYRNAFSEGVSASLILNPDNIRKLNAFNLLHVAGGIANKVLNPRAAHLPRCLGINHLTIKVKNCHEALSARQFRRQAQPKTWKLIK